MAKRFRLLSVRTLIAALIVAIGVTSWTIQRQHSESNSHLILGVSDPTLIVETAAAQASQLRAMKALGITSVRFEANWDWVQPDGPDMFDWTQLDQAVRSVRAEGMSLDLVIDGCPPWAALAGTTGDPFPQPASPTQYARWAAEVARRYAPQGVRIFEIWNEPNITDFWLPRPNPAAYTAILIAAYSAIKAVDPSGFVISGGLARAVTNGTDYSAIDFLRAMYADGARGSLDAVGYHPYSYPALPDSPKSAWSQMARTTPSLRNVMASNGDGGKSIWITEFGAPSAGPHGVGETGQATALSQAIVTAKKTRWIGALYLDTWEDAGTDLSNSNDWFGLLTADGSPKAAYKAVAAQGG